MMKTRGLVLLVVLCMIFFHTEAIGATFSYEQGTFGGIALSYRKAVIGDGNERPSLVLYLHGGSSRGSDNEAQLLEPGVDSLANYLENHDIHAVFIVPQCPAGGGWLGSMQSALPMFRQTRRTPSSVSLRPGTPMDTRPRSKKITDKTEKNFFKSLHLPKHSKVVYHRSLKKP